MIGNYSALFQAQNFTAHLLHVLKHTRFPFSVCLFGPKGPWGPGPWSKAPGAHGTPHFPDFLKDCKMVRDLSKTVRMMFRSTGKPLIHLFDFIFNSKCNVSKVCFFTQLPIELPIVLPIALIQHPSLSKLFRAIHSQNSKHLQTYVICFNKYALFFWDAVFAEKQTPEGTATQSKRGWPA